jgi:hypothetical protein
MYVETIHTERLRIPQLRQSTEGKSGPKGNARAKTDGKQIKISALVLDAKWGRRLVVVR